MNNKKRKGILIGIASVFCICLILTNSYAFWSITATQSGTNVVGSGCFDLDFIEGDAINLGSQFPISDADSEILNPYTFTITNACSIYSRYQVNLEVLPVQGTETKLDDQYVKVSLNNNYKATLTNYNYYEEVTPTVTGATTSYKLTTGELLENESITYDLREWIDQNTPLLEGQNKSFRSKITVIVVPAVEYYFLASEPVSLPSLNSVFWGGPITKGSVEEISFTTTNEVPNGVIGSWDAGLKKNGKVMAWYTDTDANNKYEVVVGAPGGVYAPENSSSLFSSFSFLNTLNLTNLNTSKATNMSNMFGFIGNIGYDASTGNLLFNEFSLDLGNDFDTSKVTNMREMFLVTGISSLDLGDKFDTSNVKYMNDMFHCAGVSEVSLAAEPRCFGSSEFILNLRDKFDTSNVTDMSGMFFETGSGNPNFTLDLGNNFDTSKVTNMEGMFFYTGNSNPNFTLDLRNFNFGAVTASANSAFLTNNTSHKIYASNSNISFMSGKGFTGTIINCTTSPASCP